VIDEKSENGCAIVMVPAGGSLERIRHFPGGGEDFHSWRAH
jgi:hypothetical protein